MNTKLDPKKVFTNMLESIIKTMNNPNSVVGLYAKDNLRISTAEVYDGDSPFETMVSHPDYVNETIPFLRSVAVQKYKTKEEAITGHELWVKTMTEKVLPDVLTDCLNSEISKLASMNGAVFIFRRKVGPSVQNH